MRLNQSDCKKCANKGKIKIDGLPCNVVYTNGCLCSAHYDIHPCKSFEHIGTPIVTPESKPPKGIKPRFIVADERLSELREAIRVHLYSNLHVPIDWIEEYNEVIAYLDSRKVKDD